MDLTRANTEAMLRFHRFHERLNRSIKFQAIGLGLLADEIERGTAVDTIRTNLYARNWLWGGMPDWNGAGSDVEDSLRDVGQGGVLRAFSAFDLFLDELQSELASWYDFSDRQLASSGASDAETDSETELDRVEKFYGRLGGHRARVSDLWAVYLYFRIARNCIAHREGIASRALVDAYEAPELKPTLDRWTKRTGDTTAPALIEIVEGSQIDFTHRQALSASSVLRLIALDLGRLTIERLGEDGFVYVTVGQAFFRDPPLPETLKNKTMLKAFNDVMSNRYRVRHYRQLDGYRVLKKLDLTKKCNAHFQTLQTRSKGE